MSEAASLLSGETALVTGAGSGIGRAIAVAIAHEGARVVLADIDREKGTRAAEALTAEGLDAIFVETDLASEGAADALFDAALASLGQISLLVHSASPRRREEDTVFTVSDETWSRMVGVNLESAFRLGRRAGTHMKELGLKGRMLFITSLHAESPRNLPHYSASKAGMTMIMKELARALGPAGIRVNALAPGAVAGGGFAANPALAAKIALGRLGAPEDIARMAVALLADRFSVYMTGTTVVVDGGLALHNWIDPSGP